MACANIGWAVTNASLHTVHITLEQAKRRVWCIVTCKRIAKNTTTKAFSQRKSADAANTLCPASEDPSSSGDMMPGDCVPASLPLPAFGVTASSSLAYTHAS